MENPNLFSLSLAGFSEHISKLSYEELYFWIIYSSPLPSYIEKNETKYLLLFYLFQKSECGLTKIIKVYLDCLDSWQQMTYKTNGILVIRMLTVIGFSLNERVYILMTEAVNWREIITLLSKMVDHCMVSQELQVRFRVDLSNIWLEMLESSDSPNLLSLHILKQICSVDYNHFVFYIASIFCRVSVDYLPPESRVLISEFLITKVFTCPSHKFSELLFTYSKHVLNVSQMDVIVSAITKMISSNFDSVSGVIIYCVPHIDCDCKLLFGILEVIVSGVAESRQQATSLFGVIVRYCGDDVMLSACERICSTYKSLTNPADVAKKECIMACLTCMGRRMNIPTKVCSAVLSNLLSFMNTNSNRILQAICVALNVWLTSLSCTDKLMFSLIDYCSGNCRLWGVSGFTRMFSNAVLLLYYKYSVIEHTVVEYVRNYIMSAPSNKDFTNRCLYLIDMLCGVGKADICLVIKSGILMDKSISSYDKEGVLLVNRIIRYFVKMGNNRMLLCHSLVIIHFHKYFLWDRTVLCVNDDWLSFIVEFVLFIFYNVDQFINERKYLTFSCVFTPSRFRLVIKAIFNGLDSSRLTVFLPKISLLLTHPRLYNVTYISNNYRLSLVSPSIYAEFVINGSGDDSINLSHYIRYYTDIYKEFGDIILSRFVELCKIALETAVSKHDRNIMNCADRGVLFDTKLLETIKETNSKDRRTRGDELLLCCTYDGVDMTELQFSRITEQITREAELSVKLHKLIDKPNWLINVLIALKRCYIYSHNFLHLLCLSDSLMKDSLVHNCGDKLSAALIDYAFEHLLDVEVVNDCRLKLLRECDQLYLEEHILEAVGVIEEAEILSGIDKRREILCAQISFMVYLTKAIVFSDYCRELSYSFHSHYTRPVMHLIHLLEKIKPCLHDHSELGNLLPIIEMIQIGDVLAAELCDMTDLATQLFDVVSYLCQFKHDCYQEVKTFCDCLYLRNDNHVFKSIIFETFLKMKSVVKSCLQTNPDIYNKLCGILIISIYWPYNEDCSTAEELFYYIDFVMTKDILYFVMEMTLSDQTELRTAGSKGLNFAFGRLRGLSISDVITKVKGIYSQHLPWNERRGDIPVDVVVDNWWARYATGLMFTELFSFYGNSSGLVMDVLRFILSLAVDDSNQEVVCLYFSVAITLTHGGKHVRGLLPVLERILGETPHQVEFDMKRHSLVTIMGSLAAYLDSNSKKMLEILDKLIETLSTPSQMVQENVAKCLPTFTKTIKSKEKSFVLKMKNGLVNSKVYGERRGYAYGLAGFCCGLGVASLKKYNILEFMTENFSNKDFICRENAAFTLEALCKIIGKPFEPYIVVLLPVLLNLIGDQNTYVRKAAGDCAKTIMVNLTADGMERILPQLLDALNDRSWRTRACSIDILSWIAHSSTQVMSQALPNVIPKLLDSINDVSSHVRETATSAINRIGSVIKNQEIMKIIHVLILALVNLESTYAALNALSHLKFVHLIDSASISIIMPVIQNGFRDKNPKSIFMSSLIFSRLAAIADPKDIKMYTPQVLPNLKLSLRSLDGNVRAITAKAFSSIAKTVDTQAIEDTLNWLYELLTKDSMSDRFISANGYFEIIKVLGAYKVIETLNHIKLVIINSDNPFVQDGCLLLLNHIINHFSDIFVPFVPPILDYLLDIFSNDSTELKNTSLGVLYCIVFIYGTDHLDLIVPQIEKVLFSDNVHVRCGSIYIIGRLFCHLIGYVHSTRSTTDLFDCIIPSSYNCEVLLASLNPHSFMKVMSAVYINCFDEACQVAHVANRVWNVFVMDTTCILIKIMPILYNVIIDIMKGHNNKTVLQSLDDVCMQMSRVKHDFISGLVCHRFCEDYSVAVLASLEHIISVIPSEHAIVMSDEIVDTLMKAFEWCDDHVNEAAIMVFCRFYGSVGNVALNMVIPSLSNIMISSKSPRLYHIVSRLGKFCKDIIPMFVIPLLCGDSVDLDSLAKLSHYMPISFGVHSRQILNSIVEDLVNTDDFDSRMEVYEVMIGELEDNKSCVDVVSFVMSHPPREYKIKLCYVRLVGSLCSSMGFDKPRLAISVFTIILEYMCDCDIAVITHAWCSMRMFILNINVGDMSFPLLRLLVGAKMKQYKNTIPGFCIPNKGIDCFMPLFKIILLTPNSLYAGVFSLIIMDIIHKTDDESLLFSADHLFLPVVHCITAIPFVRSKLILLDLLRLLIRRIGEDIPYFMSTIRQTLNTMIFDPNACVREKTVRCIREAIQVDPYAYEMANCLVESYEETLCLDVRASILSAFTAIAERHVNFPFNALVFIKESLLIYEFNTHVIQRRAARFMGLLFSYFHDFMLNEAVKEYLIPYIKETYKCVIPQKEFRLRVLYWLIRRDMRRLNMFFKIIMTCTLFSCYVDKEINIKLVAVGIIPVLLRHQYKHSGLVKSRFLQTIYNNLNSRFIIARVVTLQGLAFVLNDCSLPTYIVAEMLPHVIVCCSNATLNKSAKRILCRLVSSQSVFDEMIKIYAGMHVGNTLCQLFPAYRNGTVNGAH